MIAAGEMWDRRFSEQPWPTDPDQLLVRRAEPLPPGKGLDLGSGPGRNSLWLAAKGWSMTLLDASEVALSQAAKRADADGLEVATVHADVIAWQPPEPSYDLVVVANLHPGTAALASVLAAAASALVDGGHLFVVGHDLGNLGHHGPPDPDRLLTVDRLAAALPPTVEVEVLERVVREPGEPPPPTPSDVAVYAWATRRTS